MELRLVGGGLGRAVDGILNLHLIVAVPQDFLIEPDLLAFGKWQPTRVDLRVAGDFEILAIHVHPRHLGSGTVGQGERHHLISGGHVFLHQQRRHRQHGSDVIEAIASVVRRENFAGVILHA